MANAIGRTARAAVASLILVASLAVATGAADARTRHRTRAAVPAAEAPQQAPQRGVVGYFGPGVYGPIGPFGPGYGYGWYDRPRGDLGFALLGALNGGGLRGFVECGQYYARYPGACGF